MNRQLIFDRHDNAIDAHCTRRAIRGAYEHLELLMAVHATIARRTAVDSLADRVRHEYGVDVP